MVSKSKELL